MQLKFNFENCKSIPLQMRSKYNIKNLEIAEHQ